MSSVHLLLCRPAARIINDFAAGGKLDLAAGVNLAFA
jgi:hypothetical protein